MKAFSFNQGQNTTTNITDITSIFNSAEQNLNMIKSNIGMSNPMQINRLLNQQQQAKFNQIQPPPMKIYSTGLKAKDKAYLNFAGKVVAYKAQPERDTFIKSSN